MNYKLNLENNGKPMAIIKTNDSKKKNIPIISLGEGARNGEEEIKLKEGEVFQPIPDTTSERSINYVFGQSGSGKSFWTMKYATEYKTLYPKRSIFLFSTLKEDKNSLDKVKGIKKFNLDSPDFISDDIPIEEMKDSLIIFDDVDNISNKLLKKKVWSYMNSVLQTGRHYNISAIITYHVGCSGADTKMILNEAHTITLFPSTCGNRNLKYILDSYLGFDKNQVKKIKNLDSRWVSIVKSYPKVILSEKEAFILRNKD